MVRVFGGRVRVRAVIFVLGLLIAASTLSFVSAGPAPSLDARVAQSGSIGVTNPVYGSEWIVNRTYTISWVCSGDIGNVSIDLYFASSWVLAVAVSVQNTGGFEWTVPFAAALGWGCQVAVTDANDSNVVGMSETFAIIDKYVSVLSPSGGETWQVNTQVHIAWDYYWVQSVDIELYLSGSYHSTITESYGYWNNEFWWWVPQYHDVGTEFQVRIADASDPLVYDYSEYFTISSPPWIRVTSPNTSSSWEAGTTQEIRWDSFQVGDSLLMTLMQYGYLAKTIVNGTPNDGSFFWAIPDEVGWSSGYQVEIADVSGASNASRISDYFEIRSSTRPWINIQSPTGGTVLYSGSTFGVQWNQYNGVSEVAVELYVDGTFDSTIYTVPSGYWYYYWTVQWYRPTSTQCQIRITDTSDSSVYDLSECFTIVGVPCIGITSPTEITSWEQGTTQTIEWNSYEAGEEVSIELLKWGSSRMVLASSTANDGVFEWSIPFYLSPYFPEDAYQIRITSISNLSLHADSQWYFELRPATQTYLVVSDPSPGEVVMAGGVCDIYVWGGNNPGSTVILELYYGGQPVTLIAESAFVSSTSYWYVPIEQVPGDQYQVKATSLSNSAICAFSAVFTISAQVPRIVVTAPLSDETAIHGANLTIRWFSILHETTSVSLELWSEGTAVLVIDSSVYNDGRYIWSIPQTVPSGSYQVRVASTADPDIFGVSSSFRIIGATAWIALESFYESCGVNSTVEILWTSSGAGESVSIELYNTYGPLEWLAAITPSTPNDGSYEWMIPAGAYPSYSCIIKITSLEMPWLYGTGYVYFRSSWIEFIAPAEGDGMVPGSTLAITWSSNDAGEMLTIDLWCMDTFLSTLVTGTVDDGLFEWVVPIDLIPGHGYSLSIRPSDSVVGDDWDYVHGLWVAQPSPAYVVVTAPNGGESWAGGTVHSISWDSVGGGGSVRIELFESTSHILTIAASCPGDSPFDWTVPADLASGSEYRVRVTSTSDARAFDFSDDSFEIKGLSEEQRIVVTSPENGCKWVAGTSHVITWTWTGNLSCVKIELVRSGAVCDVVVANASCDGSYEWTVADSSEAGREYRIKVSSVADSTVFGTSEGTFSVEPSSASTQSKTDSLPTIISVVSLAVAAIAVVTAVMVARWKKS